ncbi:COP9 signalosome complex subunit 3 [Branchiostoma belcheri]|nr:COP9 signalosome complex subunit 3 [Branchiostoma belcheri]
MLQYLNEEMSNCMRLDQQLRRMDQEIAVNPQYVQKGMGIQDNDLGGTSKNKPQTCREGYLLLYTKHQCRHIRLCPVRAKLTAPANDAGFRTAEISMHRGGFSVAKKLCASRARYGRGSPEYFAKHARGSTVFSDRRPIIKDEIRQRLVGCTSEYRSTLGRTGASYGRATRMLETTSATSKNRRRLVADVKNTFRVSACRV